MNSRELIQQLTPLHGAGEARAIVRLLMEEQFQLSQTDLLLGREAALSAQEQELFQRLADRLLQGEPVQYVLGHTTFCGHRFRVTPDVLIPRPETEELVRWAVTFFGEGAVTKAAHGCEPTVKLLDLCTGSGCIAISLALDVPDVHVTAVDISPEALNVARQNAIDLGAANVSFLQADVLAPPSQFSILNSQFSILNSQSSILNSQSSILNSQFSIFNSQSSILNSQFSILNSQFSILISNPPYVCNSEASDMTPTVLQHEPHLALFVPDEDPLCFYRAIAAIGLRALCPGGLILVELNAALAEQTEHLFLQSGYTDLQLRSDQFGHTRFLAARSPKPKSVIRPTV
jgi:release factor glutamine methyltransferase